MAQSSREQGNKDQASDVLETALLDVEESNVAFSVDLDGYEGPLHVLLSLARDQKVDLRRLSILKLAEQYLQFVAVARSARIDLAADYLVMASWLAYLKSRLLLPKKERVVGEDAVEDIAAHLAWRLARLDAMRTAGESLYERPQTGLDVFVRGAPEAIAITEIPLWEADVWDLLRAYASQRARAIEPRHEVREWPVYSLDEARKRLETMITSTRDWSSLGSFAPPEYSFKAVPPTPASRYASLMVASLELAKQGKLSVRQLDHHAPLYVKEGGYE
jgi:segregation and condensation protein A